MLLSEQRTIIISSKIYMNYINKPSQTISVKLLVQNVGWRSFSKILGLGHQLNSICLCLSVWLLLWGYGGDAWQCHTANCWYAKFQRLIAHRFDTIFKTKKWDRHKSTCNYFIIFAAWLGETKLMVHTSKGKRVVDL